MTVGATPYRLWELDDRKKNLFTPKDPAIVFHSYMSY